MNSFWDKNKIPLAIILAAFIIGGFIYFSQSSQKSSVSVDMKPSSVTPTEVAQPSLTSVPATPTVTPDERAAIKLAVAKKLKKGVDELDIAVSTVSGNYAKGTVREKEAVGGGYFLAAKTETGWVIVYDGQSQPPCSDLEKYNFPSSLAAECLNLLGKVVQR